MGRTVFQFTKVPLFYLITSLFTLIYSGIVLFKHQKIFFKWQIKARALKFHGPSLACMNFKHKINELPLATKNLKLDYCF